jgi:two-component system phosphate regulon sensor histidine kinase PhoR
VYPQFSNIAVLDPSFTSVGEMVAYAPGQPRLNDADRSFIRQAFYQNEAVVSPIFTGRRSERRVAAVAVPIRDSSGQPIGVVVVTVSLDYLRDRLHTVSLPGMREIVVTDPTGQVAVATEASVESALGQSIAHVPVIQEAQRGNTGYQSSGAFNGLAGDWFVVAKASPHYGWIVSVIQPSGSATQPISNAIALDIVGFGLVACAAIAGSVFVARQILAPIEALRNAAVAWSRGDLDKRVDICTGDEFETLGETFNSMASTLSATLTQLREADRRLEDERNRLQAILYTSPAGIVVIDRTQRPVVVNPAAELLLGVGVSGDRRGWIQLVTERIFRSDGTQIRPADLPIIRSLRENVTVPSMDILVRRPNGWEARLLVNSAPIHAASGEVLGAVAVFVDITPLAEEERLRAEFVTSAAHEFRNPLTVIRGYAEVAMRDPSVKGTNVERELARILDAAARVERLADQLMRAAELHLPATVLRSEVIDLARFVETTVTTFDSSSEFRGHRISISTRPAWVKGDPGLLREALIDLLRQAVLVTPVDHPVIVVVYAWDGIATTSVTDQGPPIPEGGTESVFTPFVVSAASNPVGAPARPFLLLYLARRIIEESGGWMRARSGPSGTTISFTLPRYAQPELDGDAGDRSGEEGAPFDQVETTGHGGGGSQEG